MKINSISSQYNQSFKGKELNVASRLLKDKVFPKVAESKPFQKIATSLSYSDKSFTAIMVAESVILSSFYMINTLRNKKIKKEQKPQMLINDALTLGVSAAGSIFLDDKINTLVTEGTEKYIKNRPDYFKKAGEREIKTYVDDFMTKVGEAFSNGNQQLKKGAKNATQTLEKHLKDIVAKNGQQPKGFEITKDTLENAKQSVQEIITTKPATEAKEAVGAKVKDLYSNLGTYLATNKFRDGVKKLKTIVIFGIIYRYIGPVVVTPLANKLSSKLVGNKKTENKK